MDAKSRIVRFPPAAPRAPLGTALDEATDSGKAPPVILRVGNVVPFGAGKSDASAARRPVSAQVTGWPERGQAAAALVTREVLPRRSEWLRWSACLALALALHAAVAAALLLYWRTDEDQVAGAPLILIELAPLPVAPAVTPTGAPPGPQQTQTVAAPPPEQPAVKRDLSSQPERPVEKAKTTALPSAPPAEQPVAVLPPPKQTEQPREEKHKQSAAREASAPSSAAHRAKRAAAPAPGASARNPDALPNWKSRLVARLERYKRYPAQAQARGEYGVAQLAFSVDRAGGVHHERIVHSSGSTTLDRATLALVARAQPLPPPPPEIRGAQIAIVVPIRYNIR